MARPFTRAWTSVTELEDPRLSDYRNLRDRELQRDGTFIAESEVVLRVLARRGVHAIRSVLVAEPRLEKLSDVLGEVQAPVYVAPQGVLDGVVGFHIHRGVLACCVRTQVPDAAEWLERSEAKTLVVLESLTNHDNVGGVFRNAAAFGADGVIIDQRTCDPLYRKAVRVSVGASLFLPYARCHAISDVLPALAAAGFETWALTPAPDAVDIRKVERPTRVALLLGTEGAGLSGSVLRAATRRVKIDIDPAFDSLNVATASGVALHELRM